MVDKKDLELDELSDVNAESDTPIMSNSKVDNQKAVSASDLEPVYDIPVKVSAILGKSKIKVNQLLQLGRGAIVELDRKVGEPIDIFVNNRLVARGEVVVVEDRLGITMTEIIKTDN